MPVKKLALSCKALADETRILCLGLILSSGELCVCDFVEVLAITQSKASRHLRYLLNAGFVQDRRDGLWVHYKLRTDLNPSQKLILQTVELLLTHKPFPSLLIKLAKKQKNKLCPSKISLSKKDK